MGQGGCPLELCPIVVVDAAVVSLGFTLLYWLYVLIRFMHCVSLSFLFWLWYLLGMVILVPHFLGYKVAPLRTKTRFSIYFSAGSVLPYLVWSSCPPVMMIGAGKSSLSRIVPTQCMT